MMARFLGHHFLGTGISRKGTSIPLATGTYVHEPIEMIAKYCQGIQKSAPETPTIDVIASLTDNLVAREAIDAAIDKYVKLVDETGLKELTEQPQDIDHVVTEQCTLVGGLTWIWIITCLPWVLDSYWIIAVEKEYELIIDCTCGIGDLGTAADHEARDCNGVCLMTRPDLILQHKESGQLVYVELKTGADVMNYNYAMQYEDNIQFALGAAAAGRALDKEITHLYVHALHKGKRSGEYNTETREYDGPKRQNSSLCYIFYKEGQPPVIPEDIRPTYWNKDPLSGKRWGATENRGYKKLPLWEVPYKDIQGDMPYYEHHVRNIIDREEIERHVKFIGPIDSPNFLIERLLKEMAAEERRWAERIAYLDDVLESVGGEIANSVYQDALAEVVPRSWDCYAYGGWCDFQQVCFQKEGWDDPLSLQQLAPQARYIRRTPNHPIEINAASYKGMDNAPEE